MSNKFKPCPFCGGKSIEWHDFNTIICNECWIILDIVIPSNVATDKERKKITLKAWNGRSVKK